MVEAIYLDEGELISAGVDGYVRVSNVALTEHSERYTVYTKELLYTVILYTQVWDFETMDNADITDDNTVFEMDPLVEIKVYTYCIVSVYN